MNAGYEVIKHYYGTCEFLETVCKVVGNLLDIFGKIVEKFWGHWCKTSLNKSCWNNWVVLIDASSFYPQGRSLSHIRSSLHAQPMHQHD